MIVGSNAIGRTRGAYAGSMSLAVKVRRFAIRCAYVGLRIYWFLTRPQTNGVKCVLTDGNDVLLVRHTYGRRIWDLPGGTVRRRETPIAAARREMQEELGRRIDKWADLGELYVSADHHHDNLHLFHARVADRRLDIDLTELDKADWFPRDQLPPDLGRSVRPILARVHADQGQGESSA
jgi:8-oxo-dGTP pyrophosphatase MutT (NUDIX family)